MFKIWIKDHTWERGLVLTVNGGSGWGDWTLCALVRVRFFLLLLQHLRHTDREVFVRLLITVWTLGRDTLPDSNNLLHLQPEPQRWSAWTPVLIHCCWTDLGYQTDECLCHKTAAVGPIQAWQGTSWDHHPPLNWLCSSQTPCLPHWPICAPETEPRLDCQSSLHSSKTDMHFCKKWRKKIDLPRLQQTTAELWTLTMQTAEQREQQHQHHRWLISRSEKQQVILSGSTGPECKSPPSQSNKRPRWHPLVSAVTSVFGLRLLFWMHNSDIFYITGFNIQDTLNPCMFISCVICVCVNLLPARCSSAIHKTHS